MKKKGRKQEKVDRARRGEEGEKEGQNMKSVRLQQSSKKLQSGRWGARNPSPQQDESQHGQ